VSQGCEELELTIIEHRGDLLREVKAGIIVHGCNSLGVMGAGFAEKVTETYPQVYARYREHFEKFGLRLGDVVWARALEDAAGKPVLGFANAITQDRLARRRGEKVVSEDAVREAFVAVRAVAEKSGFPVHYPLVGCGLAGGSWEKISVIIDDALGPDVEHHLWRL
jgi:O-acetyl-ADP-ribose deacetylase (regulator of RNase III)